MVCPQAHRSAFSYVDARIILCNLTLELSRAAKRCRLERIVSAVEGAGMTPEEYEIQMLMTDVPKSLRKEIESLRKDAERYRWLRERWGKLEEIYECGTDQMLDIRDAEPGEGWRTDPATLDAAIDVAMNGANARI